MIGQYLTQTNESATVPKTKNFCQLNKASVSSSSPKSVMDSRVHNIAFESFQKKTLHLGKWRDRGTEEREHTTKDSLNSHILTLIKSHH